VVDRLLADVVVAVHLAYLAFIPLGGFLAWRWRTVIPFHIAAVAVGLTSVTIGFDCPLTTWERSLRRAGGQQPYRDGFIDHYLTGKLYPHGYAVEVQVIFGLAVVVAYVGLFLRRGAHAPTDSSLPATTTR
jgi:Protein of Unknown function (DUF2784)